ncbi:MAG: cupin domain-containing protein [Chloroflexota bacterium]|nr:cupin domain-containing protein [Chloroflexota bacterium]
MEAGLVRPDAAAPVIWLQSLGVRTLVSGELTGGRFAQLDHLLKPRTLGAPRHTHANEDEISYVLEGEIGFQLGEKVQIAGPGDIVFKPRGIPHAFWNAGDATARLLETITPAGFEGYFAAAAAIFAASNPPDGQALGALLARYQLDMDVTSIPELMAAHGLVG